MSTHETNQKKAYILDFDVAWTLSTSIYDLVLIHICHFHHHRRNGCSTLSSIEILVRLSWIPASKEFSDKYHMMGFFQLTTAILICGCVIRSIHKRWTVHTVAINGCAKCKFSCAKEQRLKRSSNFLFHYSPPYFILC